jgi:hypothetical protein
MSSRESRLAELAYLDADDVVAALESNRVWLTDDLAVASASP